MQDLGPSVYKTNGAHPSEQKMPSPKLQEKLPMVVCLLTAKDPPQTEIKMASLRSL